MRYPFDLSQREVVCSVDDRPQPGSIIGQVFDDVEGGSEYLSFGGDVQLQDVESSGRFFLQVLRVRVILYVLEAGENGEAQLVQIAREGITKARIASRHEHCLAHDGYLKMLNHIDRYNILRYRFWL